eukprot:2625508-Pyramimonas_sp.AAC.1
MEGGRWLLRHSQGHHIPSESEYAKQMFGGDGPSLWPRDGNQSTFFEQDGIDVRPVPDQEFKTGRSCSRN